MSLKVAVQMDPIEGINIEGDTTFLMMEAAQARGHSLFVYTTDTLAMDEGRVFARGRDARARRGAVRTGMAEERRIAQVLRVVLRRALQLNPNHSLARENLDALTGPQ